MSYGDFRDPFKKLTETFFEEYFKHRKDDEMFEVSPLFYAFRAIVSIHPVFYSREWMRSHGFSEERLEKSDESKKKIINFMRNVLDEKEFDVKKINSYLKD